MNLGNNDSCLYCMHRGRKNSSSIMYIPICKMRMIKRELPYAENKKGNRIYAEATFVRPDWCPIIEDVPQ